MFKKIRKRDGRVVRFDSKKIADALAKAGAATGEFDHKIARALTLKVLNLAQQAIPHRIPTVEGIQDVVEEVLLSSPYRKTAKAYIIYREQHAGIREITAKADVDMVDQYLDKLDWQVNENSNMTFSLQGLNNYISSEISKTYWLIKIYPPEVRQAHLNGDFHIHDLNILSVYCVGWDLFDLLVEGFRGAPGKVESEPAKHFRSALGQVVNFFYSLQGEAAGAQAFSNFDTLLSPFIRYDGLGYEEVKQALQEFVFNVNVPTRVGFQAPFTNITLDLTVPEYYANQSVVIGGVPQKETYADFKGEMELFNRALLEVMAEGDARGRVFTFPIPTYNITKDFDWANPNLDVLWQVTAKYGVPYFSNFINSDMNPEDARSMCCRLRIDNRELERRGGGLFGSSPLTGSIGVVTLNMPRLGYSSARDEEAFISALERLMVLAKESLEIKRKVLENLMDKNLYPYTKYYLRGVKERFGEYWKNHFSTIGLVGMNEACLNMFGEPIASEKSRAFTSRVLDFMRDKLLEFQEETGNNYNLEATPAEGTSYRLAKKDKESNPKIVCANEEDWKRGAEPFYTNSTQLPVNYTEDIFEALDLQDTIQTKYTGGCLEEGNKVLTDKGLLKIEKVVKDFTALKPIKALSYNPEEGISEWDEITDAITVNLKRQNKIRVKGERGLDIVTSDWHPFFILEKVKSNPVCPVCGCGVKNIKSFATHLRWNPECRIKYHAMPKYQVVERRADELKEGDYILQNSCNLYPERGTKLNPDLMWLIGFFIGDGSMSEFVDNRGGNNLKKYRVRFSSEQQLALRKAARILNKYFGCKVKVIQNDKRSEPLREVTTSKKEVASFFFKLGFTSGKKVYNISIPKEVKDEISSDNVYSLLSGLGDSDGHIGRRDGDFEYSTVSSKLAEDILEICTRAGIMVSKGKKKARRKNEEDTFRLRISNRKKRYLPVVRVKEVSKDEVQDTQFYDLTTQKNHNYLAGKNTLIFVHNTVFHVFAGERVEDPMTVKTLVRRICELYHLPYFTFTPTFSVCPTHGYIVGEHYTCPECGAETEVYSRVVGYLRPVNQWNKGKREEFKLRKTFAVGTGTEAVPKLEEEGERKAGAGIAIAKPSRIKGKAKPKRKHAGKQLNLIDLGGAGG